MTASLVAPTVSTVPVGTDTPVNLGMVPQGTTLANTDSDNAVYLSSDPSVGPLNGIRVGPLGTISWSTTSPCYAIAVGGTVIVTLSQLVSHPVNPVDTAEAVAALLAVTGVPSKLLVTNIGTFLISSVSLEPIPVDMTAYASILIVGSSYTFPITYAWSVSGLQLGENDAIYPDPASNIYTVLPVLAPTLSMYSSGSASQVTIIGFNRILPNLQPRWGAVWTGTVTPSGPLTIPLALTHGTIPTVGLSSCFLQAYPLPTGQTRIQVQASNALIGVSTPNLILQDYTMPTSGTGIFTTFQASFPPVATYGVTIRLFVTPTANCGIILHTIQNSW